MYSILKKLYIPPLPSQKILLLPEVHSYAEPLNSSILDAQSS